MVNNYAKYITDTVCGYVLGNSIKYTGENDEDIGEILKLMGNMDTDIHDAELEKDLSVFGVGYELIYMDNKENPMPRLALIDPRNAVIVYDDTVEENPLFGIYYLPEYDEKGKIEGYLTFSHIFIYKCEEDFKDIILIDEKEHYFNEVPFVEYRNNEEAIGDFAGVISLIDSYNILQSDRINDKERFVDAILLVVNAQMEPGQAKTLQKSRMLELPENSDARYITKSLNEEETQILADAIKDDIHKFSQTPDFTDEKFSGNTSGVAMAYKLLSLENLAKVKERFLIAGLKKRLKILNNLLISKGKKEVDINNIKITLNRTLPVNEMEISQMINLLKDTVSHATLISRLPFVEDIESEITKVKEERREKDQSLINSFDERYQKDMM